MVKMRRVFYDADPVRKMEDVIAEFDDPQFYF
jgi:hypothetical protein